MNEFSDIYTLYSALRRDGGSGVLATVLRTTGSTYRRAAARMLVTPDGRSAGLISGGCLETDLRERSADVLATGRPRRVTYDSTSPDDVLWGLGLGCSGAATVLLERVSAAEPSGVLEFIDECRRTRVAGAIAHLAAGGPTEERLTRVFRRQGLALPSQEGYNDPEGMLAGACARVLSTRESSHLTVTLPGGNNEEAFIEYVASPVPLFVFGAGPDAAPLVTLAHELGWHVTVVDARAAYLTKEAFPVADELVLAHPSETGEAITIPQGAAAVIMTHNFNNDVSLAKSLLPTAASYVGLLGPRSKGELLLGKLAEEGFLPTEEELERLHSPVGLDLGAETPEEIALAIVAEIQASLRKRPATPLRHREGSIHA
jgi:xanthine dehydrogenase accessory factor